MNPSNPSMPSNPSGQKWTEQITHDSGAFLRAFQQGGISTDDLQAPNPADLLPAGSGVFPSAVTSTFSAFNGGILTTFGDNLDNTITFSRDAAGKILVNGGAVPVVGGTPTVANTTLIQAFGQGGNDNISLNEANGALPAAYLFGGTGNDTLIGGSGGDLLFGQSGNDTLLGKGGNDLLFGGSDNDVLTGGDGDDQMFGESGNDRMVWNPGDDSDLMEGGDGVDTAEVNGGNGAETFTATANGTRVRFDRIDPAPFALDIGTTENLVVNMNGGDDSFSASGNLASLIKLTVDGGAGNDRINGGNGDDLLIGGDGNDFIDGNQGKDTALLGAGEDVFQWDPGDGNDTVDGQDGSDTMVFNGSAVNEKFDLSANGSHVRLTRDIGSIVMDVNGVERIDLAPRGGTDVIAVNDLGGTGVTAVNIDLAATPGSGVGDGAADTTIINGTNNVDVVDVFGAGTSLSVVGLSAQVNVAASEGANDQLVVNGQGGDDTMSAITVQAGITRLTMDGGGGNDTMLGSQGADTLRGGDGDDFVRGNRGDDSAVLGAGDDAFQWNPGDGSDTVEGGDGSDRMLFFGANIAEHIDISANGGRVRFTRDIASVVMDLNDVEQIEFRALGGADNIVVGDLSGTDATRIDLDLRGPSGGPDGQVDAVTVNGTQGGNTIVVAGDPGGVTVVGLPAQVNAFFTDPTDQLTINGQGGDDVIDATGLKADGIALTLNGGLGADFMLGGQGNDLIVGGDGNDTALMGAGDDTFVWNPGDDNDTLEGEAGFDTMLFNGANVAENIDISANGGRVRFSRDVASVTMDLNDVEHIVFNARGGADRIAINDMSGTDVTQADINLEGAPGSGDGAADVVTVKGTTGDDVVQVVGDASGVSVLGLAARANVNGAEAALDRLVIEANAGNDVVDGTGLTATAIGFTANGGDGDDILIGGAGNDILRGGAGDDILIGNDGDDILDGGPGNDILLGGNGLDTLLNGEVAIQSFVAGAGTDDRMDLRALSGMTFDWLIEHAKMVDGNAVLDLGNGGHVTLIGVDVGALHPDDFLMGG